MSRAKGIISKKLSVNQIGWHPMPKLFSVGLVSLLGALPLSSMPNRSLMAHAQVEHHYPAIYP
jgi:hypothetical protein